MEMILFFIIIQHLSKFRFIDFCLPPASKCSCSYLCDNKRTKVTSAFVLECLFLYIAYTAIENLNAKAVKTIVVVIP